MSDNLEWMNEHAVLLREPIWKGIAERENYKIRPDLRPMFEAHPDSLELLKAMAEAGKFREGCEFIARMTHRRAAVWWGYCCLMDLFRERRDVESGAVKREPDEIEKMALELEKGTGIKMPKMSMKPEDIDNMCKMPDVDFEKLLATPVPPPQDASALKAASAEVQSKASAIESLIPPEVKEKFAASRAKVVAESIQTLGRAPEEIFEEARSVASKSPLTYSIDRFNSPQIQKILSIRDILEKKRQATIAQVKGAFPEKYPATPEAALLLKADKQRISDDAVQAVWRWIVAPDERNTTLALEAGNAAAGSPEGMLAYTAAWSFGDLTPEGKQLIPVPPELPGTGLNSALLMMALDQDGTKKMPERYEIYFNLGLEVVFGKTLWPDAVVDDLSPHRKIETMERPGPAASASTTSEGKPPVYRKWGK